MSSSRLQTSLTGPVDLLGDQHRLPHEILDRCRAGRSRRPAWSCAPPPCSRGTPRCIRRGRERGLAVLRRRPDLDPVGGHVRGAILRLERGMGEERHLVFGFDSLGRRAARPSATSPCATANAGVRRRSGPGRGCAASIDLLEMLPLPPESQVGSAALDVLAWPATSCPPPPRPRRRGARPGERPSCRRAWLRRSIASVPLKYRTLGGSRRRACRAPARRFRRSAAPVTLSRSVEVLARRADQRPVLGLLQRDLRRRRHGRPPPARRRRSAELRPLGRWVIRLSAARHSAAGDVPSLAPPRRSASRALRRRPGASSPARRSPRGSHWSTCRPRHAIAPEILGRRGKFGFDLGPVAFELFGHQHGQRREDALAHFRAARPG